MSSKFSSIIAAKKGDLVDEADQIEETAPTPVTAPAQKPKPARKQVHSPTPAASSKPDNPRLGRPATGKRSDPDFDQVTAYIRHETYQAVKIVLLQEGGKRDFSSLTEELLTKWLKSQNK